MVPHGRPAAARTIRTRVGRYRLLGRSGRRRHGRRSTSPRARRGSRRAQGGPAQSWPTTRPSAAGSGVRSSPRFRVSGMCTARLVDFDTEADHPWMATEFVEGRRSTDSSRRAGPADPGAAARAGGRSGRSARRDPRRGRGPPRPQARERDVPRLAVPRSSTSASRPRRTRSDDPARHGHRLARLDHPRAAAHRRGDTRPPTSSRGAASSPTRRAASSRTAPAASRPSSGGCINQPPYVDRERLVAARCTTSSTPRRARRARERVRARRSCSSGCWMASRTVRGASAEPAARRSPACPSCRTE